MGYFSKLGRRWVRAVTLLTLVGFVAAPAFAGSKPSMADAWSSHKQSSKKKPPRKPKFVGKPAARTKAKPHAGKPHAGPRRSAAKAKHSGKPPRQARRGTPAKSTARAKHTPKAVAAVKAKSKPKAKKSKAR